MQITQILSGVSVVIPVYNSSDILPQLVTRLGEVLSGLTEIYELILINDGSCDKSWEVICQLAKVHRWVRGINLMRNYGQHNALLCGIRKAEYEIIVTMDDDLQHPPEEIHKLLEKLMEDYDVVYGVPGQEQHGLMRDIASKTTKFVLQKAIGAETVRYVSAFRAFRTSLREAFANFESPLVSIDVLLTWGTSRFTFIKVKHNPRPVGESNYSFVKLLTHTLNMVTGFSTIPLKLASWTGFAFTIFGLIILVYVITRYLIEGGSVPGFPFLASIIAIFSGAQLFALGIIGEYMARMHYRSVGKPPYMIRNVIINERNKIRDGQ